ncbi:hypothetical protein PBN90_09475 [Enterococcus faecalis]|uniref:GNAT family N-acetyltransferase n=1 Tax=Enterococcus faecalis TaxID=1351 RepID=UPI002458CF83|nr:hypothetical protein [Enterococcus faecalis]MDH4720530.1 hypothetical protein [Enterococcus faecalis]
MEYNCYGQPIGPSLKESCFRELNATIIEGNTCDLIHASESHAHVFYTDIFKKDLLRQIGLICPSHPFHQKKRLLISSTRLFVRRPYFFGIWNKEHSKVLGTLALMRNDRQNGVIEVGYVIYSQQLKKAFKLPKHSICWQSMFLRL